MKKLLGIVVLGLLLSGNAYAGMYKGVKEQGSNYIILKEKKRNYESPSFPEPTDGLQVAENYCSSKGLYSFYIIGKLAVPDRLYNIWPDFQPGLGFKDYHRYFCAKNANEALSYFKSNIPESFKSNINSNNRWAKNQSEISEYIVKSGNKKIAKLMAEEKKKIAEKPKKQEPENRFTSQDLKATLIYWGLGVDNYFFSFNDRGSMPSLSGDLTIKKADTTIDAFPYLNSERYEFFWEPKGANQLDVYIRDDKFKGPNRSFKLELDFNNKIAIMSSYPNHNDKKRMKIYRPEKLFAANGTSDDEKPKKKKPEFTPDENKIVPAASGTGFFVSRKGHVITNYHVIEGCDQNKLSFDGKEIKADTLAIDKVNDLAILKANLRPKKVYPVATEDVTLLQDVIIAGYPLGKKVSSAIKTSKGSITALAGYKDNFSEFQTDAALNQGNSGGPIMNQKGNVVGVAVANYGKKEGVESFNFGIKSSTLRTFASSNGLKFLSPNRRDLSNKDLGELITKGTVYLECYMTVAKIKRMIAEAENRKAFFSEYAN